MALVGTDDTTGPCYASQQDNIRHGGGHYLQWI